MPMNPEHGDSISAPSTSPPPPVHTKDHNQKDLTLTLEEYQNFFENALEGFFQVSPTGLFLSVNASLARILRFSDQEELTTNIRNALVQCLQDKGDRRELLDRLRREDGAVEFEAIFLRQDKTGFWGSTSIRSIRDENGHLLGYAGNLTDISDRREKDRYKRELEKAALRDQAQKQFLTTLCHEIRTPLQPILGLTQLAISNRREDLRLEYLMTIKKVGEQLSRLIESILDYALIESGKVRLNEADFHLRRFLMSVLGEFSQQAEDKGLELTFTMAPDLPEWVRGDGNRLGQILETLIQNALKFTPSGRVALQAWQEQEDEESDRAVRLFVSISDTGIGVPQDKEDLIFEPFRQAEPSFRRIYGGVGLGLAISKQLAQIMGGEIHVGVTPGQGSVFTIETLLHRTVGRPWEPEQGEAKFDTISGSNNCLRLLLVEDNPTNAFYMKELLRPLNHEVILASSGKEALALLSTINVDAVLMDVEMPEMDGMETARRIRNGEAGPSMADIPIIAVSAHCLDEVKEGCLLSGMGAFLTKPIDVQQLLQLLEKLAPKKDAWCDVPPSESPEAFLTPPQAGASSYMNTAAYIQRLQELFEQTVSRAVAKLGEALSQRDATEVAHQAHAIVNSAVVVGADELAGLSRRIESRAMAGNLESIGEDYGLLLAFDPTSFRVTMQNQMNSNG